MTYDIDDITKRLDLIVEPCLERDDQGNFLEIEGKLRRTTWWPNRKQDYAEGMFRWLLHKEDEYGSTLTFLFDYCIHETFGIGKVKRKQGFLIDNKHFGNSLDDALIKYEEKLKKFQEGL